MLRPQENMPIVGNTVYVLSSHVDTTNTHTDIYMKSVNCNNQTYTGAFIWAE